jgi:hydroxymethylglutaryl-CoA reductase
MLGVVKLVALTRSEPSPGSTYLIPLCYTNSSILASLSRAFQRFRNQAGRPPKNVAG